MLNHQRFIQAVLLKSLFERRLELKMLLYFVKKRSQNYPTMTVEGLEAK